MQQIRNISVQSTHHDKPILTDVFYKETSQKKPLVIFCHGYKGYKDWGAWNLAAENFANQQLFFVKFNFSHNGGTAENPIDFPDLEAFGANNYSLELDDLEDVINWIVRNGSYSKEVDVENITLIGHSRGGGIVSIKSAENKAIKRLITWSGVSDYKARFPTGEQLEGWKKEGVNYVLNGRTNQQMPHLFQFYEDFTEYEERLTIKNAVSKLSVPHLIIHGQEDQVVLPVEAENMHLWNSASKLVFVKGMNHPLGCSQPWMSAVMPVHLEAVVKESIDFIKQG